MLSVLINSLWAVISTSLAYRTSPFAAIHLQTCECFPAELLLFQEMLMAQFLFLSKPQHIGCVYTQDAGLSWGSWSLDLYTGSVWKEIALFPCFWGTSFPSKVFNHLICVKEHRLFISSCASTEDASLLMNPGLETSPVWGDMKAQGGDKT